MKACIATLFIFYLFTGASGQHSAGREYVVREEYVFPFQKEHVHGSSMVILPGGDILAAWFQGSGERTADDVRIMGARLRAGTQQWSEPFLMADTKGIPDCNPVLYLNSKGRLFLFWIAVQANRWESSVIRFRTSVNYSEQAPPVWNWQDNILLKPDESFNTEVRKRFSELPENNSGWAAYAPQYDRMIIEASGDPVKRSFGWMTRIHPISLKNGRILLPLYSDGFNFSLVAISDDDGETWRPSLPLVGRGPIQPSLALRKDGTIVAFMRDSGDPPNRVHTSVSSDNGESWSASVKTDIPNEASVETCVMRNGIWAFLGNDISDGRYRLSLYLSDDEGKSWKWKVQVEDDPLKKGSFSYPCLVESSDGLLHMTYSYNAGEGKKTIKHLVANPARITGGN